MPNTIDSANKTKRTHSTAVCQHSLSRALLLLFSGAFCCDAQALMVDALADKRLYEQELARMRKENAFLEDQARGRHNLTVFLPPAPSLCFFCLLYPSGILVSSKKLCARTRELHAAKLLF